MSGVDVLAVLDEVSRFHDNGSEAFDSLREAREAVAELIEAASDHVNGGEIGAVSRKERLLAALSRVRGAE